MASEIWADTSAFVCEIEDGIAVVRVRSGLADILQVLEVRDAYLTTLRRIADDDAVRGFLEIFDQDSPDAAALDATLADLARRPNATYTIRRLRLSLEQCVQAIAAIPKPTVIALDRGTAGFFLSAALTFDAIVATPEARVTFPSRELGLPPAPQLVYRLVQAVGRRRTARVLYGSDDLTSTQAHELGLFERIVPRAGLEAGARAHLADLMALPRAYFAAAKAMLAEPLGDPIDHAERCHDLARPYYTEALELRAG